MIESVSGPGPASSRLRGFSSVDFPRLLPPITATAGTCLLGPAYAMAATSFQKSFSSKQWAFLAAKSRTRAFQPQLPLQVAFSTRFSITSHKVELSHAAVSAAWSHLLAKSTQDANFAWLDMRIL